MGLRNKSGEICERWVKIKYDYVPKYCKTYMIQGHDEEQCYVVHPELFFKKNNEEKKGIMFKKRRQG